MTTTYCLKCKSNTNNINPVNKKAVNGKPYILSKCAKCGSKKSTFVSSSFVRNGGSMLKKTMLKRR